MALSVCIAAVNVGSALIMLAIERARDIAILKSAGASRGFIVCVFLVAGMSTGVIGTILGVGLGSLVAWRINDLIHIMEFLLNILSRIPVLWGGRESLPTRLLDPAYYLEVIPIKISLVELSLVGLFAIGVCLAASVLPALRTASRSPLDIYRKT
jgi:lipoprotein-releasing system permease protein